MTSPADPGVVVWREAPDPTTSSPDQPWEVPARWLFAVVVAVIGPLVRSLFLGSLFTEPWRVAAIVAGASLVTGALGERRWWQRGLIALGAGAVLVAPDGELVAVWAVAGIVLGDWAVRRWPPAPRIPCGTPGAVLPVALLMGLAAWQSRSWTPGLRPLFFVGLAVVVTAVGAFSAGRLDSALARFGRWVGAAVAWLAFAVLALPLVVLPWAAYRLARVNPLDVLPGTGPQWLERRPGDAQPGRMWSKEPLVIPPSAWSRWRRARLAMVALVVLIPAVIVIAIDDPDGSAPQFQGFRLVSTDNDAAPEVQPVDIIMGDEEWYDTFRNEFGIAMSDLVYEPFGFRRMRDMVSTYVNIEDGARRSWVPPECDCPTVTVWMYGGSTGFGFNQRDEHTIASEVARAAWEEGIRLEVVNRGIPGDTHWREGLRFSWDVTRYPAPDVAVFYDGVNDSWATHKLVEESRGDIDEPVDPVLADIEKSLASIVENDVPDLPDTVSLPPDPDERLYEPEDEGVLVVERYDSSRKIAADVAVANDIAVEYFWQPSRLSRPSVEGELQGEGDAYARRQEDAMREALPPDVHDLTGVFEGNTEAMFTDDVHHSEEGARIIGVAMFEAIEERLRELVDAKGGAPCGC